MALPLAALILVVGGLLYMVFSGTSMEDFQAEHGHGHHHHHEAPHGGALIVLGLHDAHVEVTHDTATGEVGLFAHDGHLENMLVLDAEPITLEVRPDPEGDWMPITLLPDEDGEYRPIPERAMHFSAVVPALVGVERFGVRVPPLELAGRNYDGVTTSYPEGNE